MNEEKELTPQQQFENVLSSAAVDIARMEQVRDAPGRPDSPAPTPKPPGAPPHYGGAGRHTVDRDQQNDLIAQKKADALKSISEIGKKVSAEMSKAMQDKALNTFYPPEKSDLNQIARDKNNRDEKGNHKGDKEIDNAQERANALRSRKRDKDKDKDDKKIDRSQDKMKSMREKQKDDLSTRKMDVQKQKQPDKKQMSKQFKQPLVQNKNVMNPAQSKSKTMSMSTRFSQSLSHSKTSPSSPGRSSPGKSSRGGRGGGSRGGGGRGGKSKG